MRAHTLATAVASLAVLALPFHLGAQGRRPSRPPSRGVVPTLDPEPPAPQAPPVAREIAYRRSRWSTESYAYLNSMQVPTPHGISTVQSFGAGLHGGYWYTENLAFTMDAAASNVGDPANTQTFEVGTRYSPLAWERNVRPFFDVRGSYMRMYDTFALPEGAVIGSSDYSVISRYGRGFGAGAGAGLEISLNRSFALTTELVALRSRMDAFDSSSPTIIPPGSRYWMTTARYVIGLRYSPVHIAHLSQKPNS